jgi:hypothetical protein
MTSQTTREAQHQSDLAAVAAHLTEEGIAASTIAERLGVNPATIRARLVHLEALGRAARIRTTVSKGVLDLWCPANVVARVSAKHGDGVYQITVKTYPAVDERDPLVAALFGQAGRAAP